MTQGGDDYVTKPFSLDEVVARLRGLVRRSVRAVAASNASLITVGDLSLDEDAPEVFRSGNPIPVTSTKFELLRYFVQNPRRPLTKARILERVSGFDFGGQSSIVEINVSYLRKKIDAGHEGMIHTVRGSGYLLKAPDIEPPEDERDGPR